MISNRTLILFSQIFNSDQSFSLLIITSIVFNNSALCTADSFQTPLETDNILISETVEYFPDGSSITITITESSAITYATKYTKTGTKTYSARNSSGEIQWQFMINGTFTVTEGISSVCTSASYSYNILKSNWSFNGGSAHTADNAAVGSGEFTRTLFFIPVETRECNVTLTCDNISTTLISIIIGELRQDKRACRLHYTDGKPFRLPK